MYVVSALLKWFCAVFLGLLLGHSMLQLYLIVSTYVAKLVPPVRGSHVQDNRP